MIQVVVRKRTAIIASSFTTRFHRYRIVRIVFELAQSQRKNRCIHLAVHVCVVGVCWIHFVNFIIGGCFGIGFCIWWEVWENIRLIHRRIARSSVPRFYHGERCAVIHVHLCWQISTTPQIFLSANEWIKQYDFLSWFFFHISLLLSWW